MIATKTWRISLTQYCNYKCFFCHEEGFVMSEKRKQLDVDLIYQIIIKGMESGFIKFAFTGGEPLLEKKALIDIINKLNNLNEPPILSIITNGYLIDDAIIHAVKNYTGSCKFNVSLHAIDEQIYSKIVNTNNANAFETVLANIKKLLKNNIQLKLNFVLLKNINNDKSYIEEIIKFATSNKIKEIKFLELLITDKLVHLFDYYYDVYSIENMFKKELTFLKDEKKRKTYKYKNSDLNIELQQCPCKVGCFCCPDISGRILTSDAIYFPCFTLNADPVDLKTTSCVDAFNYGDSIIKKLGAKFGNGSPLIIQNTKHLVHKNEYYYELVLSEYEYLHLKETLIDKHFILLNKRKFIEFYFESADSNSKNIIYKIYQNDYNKYKYNHVHSHNILIKNNGTYSNQITYLTKPENAIWETFSDFEIFAKNQNFQYKNKLSWDIDFYEYQNYNFSISTNLETGKKILLSTSPISSFLVEKLNLKNIPNTIPNYLF